MGRHESFDPTNAIPFSLRTMGEALPAAGSPEALEAFGAACRAVDAASRLSDADMESLHIAPGASLWTSDKATDALSGNFSRFMPNEIEAARATPRTRLEDLQILALRRELRMAEAARSSRIRELHALVYGDEPDPADEDEVPVQAEADPRLIAMVAEWQDVRRKIDDPAAEETPELDALAEGHSTQQREIYLYPARSMLDLLAKVPLLRDELTDVARGYDADGAPKMLAHAAWIGVLADIERIAGATPNSAPPADAELIALGHAFDAATIRYQEACAASDAADDRADARKPERPADLLVFGGSAPGGFATRRDIEGLQEAVAEIEDGPERAAALTRVNQMLGALQAWEAECDRVFSEENLDATNAAVEAANAATAAIAKQVAALPARTLAGVWVKVRIAAFCGVCDPTASPAEGYTGEAVLRSLYRDAPRLVLDTETAAINIVPEADAATAAEAARYVPPAEQSEADDAELIALGRAFDTAAAQAQEAEDEHDADPANHQKRIAADKAAEPVYDLAEQIAPLPVHTLAGARVKLRLAAFYSTCLPRGPHEDKHNGEIAIRSLYRSTPGIVLGAGPFGVRIVPEA